MLLNFIIFALCVVGIRATGEFTILNSPKSLSFEGDDPLQSHDVGEVAYVAMGNPISGTSNWTGMIIVKPFELPKHVIGVSLNGVSRSKLSAAAKTYPLEGDNVEQSLNDVTSHLEANNVTACTISFEQINGGILSFRNVVGDVKIPPVTKTKYLNGDLHTADKDFLQSCACLNAIADNFFEVEKSCKFVQINLFLEGVVKAHGLKSDSVDEAVHIFCTAVERLNTAAKQYSNNDALVIVAVNKADGNSRSKRSVVSSDTESMYNFADYYNQDYPVIFNIIFWFMVVFGFALFAICYAIGSMDPGRDSIIYRMTSTRMKKDN